MNKFLTTEQKTYNATHGVIQAVIDTLDSKLKELSYSAIITYHPWGSGITIEADAKQSKTNPSWLFDGINEVYRQNLTVNMLTFMVPSLGGKIKQSKIKVDWNNLEFKRLCRVNNVTPKTLFTPAVCELIKKQISSNHIKVIKHLISWGENQIQTYFGELPSFKGVTINNRRKAIPIVGVKKISVDTVDIYNALGKNCNLFIMENELGSETKKIGSFECVGIILNPDDTVVFKFSNKLLFTISIHDYLHPKAKTSSAVIIEDTLGVNQSENGNDLITIAILK